MIGSLFFRVAADAILALHVLVVLFVVSGLLLIVIGGVRGWAWVKNPWFRLTHLVTIGVVVAQAWLGAVCPLTNLEMALRLRAGDAVYQGGFIAHWMQRFLYYDAPLWVFAVCYTGFALLVVGSWILVRPRPFTRQRQVERLEDI